MKITFKIGDSQGPFTGEWEDEADFYGELVEVEGHRKSEINILKIED